MSSITVVTVLPAGKLPASCLADVVPAELGGFTVAIGVSDGHVWRVAVDAVLTDLQKYDAQIGKPRYSGRASILTKNQNSALMD